MDDFFYDNLSTIYIIGIVPCKRQWLLKELGSDTYSFRFYVPTILFLARHSHPILFNIYKFWTRVSKNKIEIGYI